MKMSWMGLVLGLGLLMAISSDAVPLSLGHPDLCCFKFVTFKIPEANILKIEKTHPECPKPGYVITTKMRKLCKEEVVLKKD